MADKELLKFLKSLRHSTALHAHWETLPQSQDFALPVELNGKIASSRSADARQEVKSVLHVEGSDRYIEGWW